MTRRASRAGSVRLRCSASERCSFHAEGGPVTEPCPGQCDARGCTLAGFYEVGRGRLLCAAHGALVLLARAVREALATDDAEGGRAPHKRTHGRAAGRPAR